ncbi:TonB-dependent receptor plug domain-containing protein [bacterium]|nr:TonB-dependent receptor plug domain-containing protein [bacterium]
MRFPRTGFFSACCLFVIVCPVLFLGQTHVDLTSLSLEELMSLEVTSVSKKPQRLSDVPSSVYVIPEEYISGSGARSIAELLRFAPGMEVASIDANKWSISARGFIDRFANKLLVLMDGRSVYLPLFSGVYWDAQDFILEDIERIEIVRGPGASVWGANAVNGVVNIITKSAAATQGGHVSGVWGNQNKEACLRYGFRPFTDWSARVYTKAQSQAGRMLESGRDAGDSWQTLQWGLRMDGSPRDNHRLTIQGDGYSGKRGRTIMSIDMDRFELFTLNETGDVSGGNILARWKKTISERSDFTFQGYLDYSSRHAEELIQKYSTMDLDAQHRIRIGENDLIWGGSYRLVHDRLQGTYFTNIQKESRSYHLFSGFFQDEFQWMRKRLCVTWGSKVEHNSFTGFEYQPTLRAIWKGFRKHRFWLAVSRAVRTPSRMERDALIVAAYSPAGALTVQGDYPLFGRLEGHSGFDSEDLIAYESGYRYQTDFNASLDFSSFYNRYDGLRIGELGNTFLMDSNAIPYIEQYIRIENGMNGRTAGVECVLDWTWQSAFRARLIYSYLWMSFDYDKRYLVDGLVLSDYSDEKSPDHQAGIWLSWRFGHGIKWDAVWHYKTADTAIRDPLNHYSAMRLAWQWTDCCRIAVVGQNLLEADKIEYTTTFPGVLVHNAMSTEPARRIFIQTTFQWR